MTRRVVGDGPFVPRATRPQDKMTSAPLTSRIRHRYLDINTTASSTPVITITITTNKSENNVFVYNSTAN